MLIHYRLYPVGEDYPLAMSPVGNKPILSY
jgi:NDP-sugar pyrophosphorylase family protein